MNKVSSTTIQEYYLNDVGIYNQHFSFFRDTFIAPNYFDHKTDKLWLLRILKEKITKTTRKNKQNQQFRTL